MPKDTTKSKKIRVRGKRWTITQWLQGVDWDPETVTREMYEKIIETRPVKYYVGQVEIAPTTKKPHIQAYVEFTHALDLATVCKAICFRGVATHAEPSLGDDKANTRYCSKDDTALVNTRFIFGEAANKGVKVDPVQVMSDIKEGKLDYREAAGLYPRLISSCRYVMEMQLQSYNNTRRDWVIESINYHCGPTSTGKTTMAVQHLESKGPWWPFNDCATFSANGYEPDMNVLIDDINIKGIPTPVFLKLLRPTSGRPYQANTKGGFVYMNPKCIELCSNFLPSANWPNTAARNPICARIQEKGKFYYHPKMGEHYVYDTEEALEKGVREYELAHPEVERISYYSH